MNRPVAVVAILGSMLGLSACATTPVSPATATRVLDEDASLRSP